VILSSNQLVATSFCCVLMAIGPSDRLTDDANASSGASGLIDIEARAELTPEIQLHVTLTNRSAEKLEIFEHSLPWRGAHSMILAAVETDPAGTPLERTLPIDDPGPGKTSIEPGETQSGEIALGQRFPAFAKTLAQRDILVFWAYRFQPVGQPPLSWSAGHVIFLRALSDGDGRQQP
jgi:hypothetical protein